MPDVIPGLKLIRHNASNADLPDDPSLPFKLEANFSPPEFMIVTFIGLFGGSEELVVRSVTKEALDQFMTGQDLRRHPRLRHLTITGPDGIIEQIPKSAKETSPTDQQKIL